MQRSTTHRTSRPRATVGTAVVATATALTGLAFLSPATATAAPAEPVTTQERGIVLECTGRRHGLDAYAALYENDVYGNTVQIVLDDDPQQAGNRNPADVWSAGEVRTGLRIGEHRATVRGTAHRVPFAQRTAVHEEMDDAGQHIVVDGFHRRLVTDLVLRYDGTRVPLSCDPAFAYRLSVTKTDITGG